MNLKLLLVLTSLSAVTFVRAQDLQPIPTEELAKATALLLDANERLGELPLKLELAPERATGFKAGEAGVLLIPDKRLKAEKPAKDDKAARKAARGTAMPVGQLWTMKIAPKDKDAVLANDKLRLTKITAGDKERELAVFTLGIERSGKRELQLAIYGKGSSPVLRVPLTAEKAKGAAPVVMSARKTNDDSGVVELKLMGRYKAEIPMSKMAE